jgi:hypothetical protein
MPEVVRTRQKRLAESSLAAKGVHATAMPSKSCGIWRKSLSLTQRWLPRRTSCRPARARIPTPSFS